MKPFLQNISLISIYIFCTILLIVQFLNQSGKLKLIPSVVVIMLSFFLVDLTSGCVHYFLDHYDGKNNFIKQIAEEFQEHHDIPSMLVNDNSILDMVGQAAMFWPLGLLFIISNQLFNTNKHIILGQIVFLVVALFTQVSHYLSHMMVHKPPKRDAISYMVLHFLQKNSILLDPAVHKVHHRTLTKNYSILNGWSNKFLNMIL